MWCEFPLEILIISLHMRILFQKKEKLSFGWWRHDFVNSSNKSFKCKTKMPTKQKHFQQTNYYPMLFLCRLHTHTHNDDDTFLCASLLVKIA